MTADEPFIAGIRAEPLDDLRRLVYADWLDEHDRPAEAEYLRLVAAMAATGAAVDLAHPHAVRLLALVPELEPKWREAVGGRFDLWFDEIRPNRLIYFIKCVRQLSNYGLPEAKMFSETLPKALSGLVPFEEAAAQASVAAEAVIRYRIVPSTEVPSRGLLRCDLSLTAWYDDRSERGWLSVKDITSALGHVRRILQHDPEFAPLASGIPQTLDLESPEYSVVLEKGLLAGEASRRAKQLNLRLFGDSAEMSGYSVVPPFAGSISVDVAWR